MNHLLNGSTFKVLDMLWIANMFRYVCFHWICWYVPKIVQQSIDEHSTYNFPLQNLHLCDFDLVLYSFAGICSLLQRFYRSGDLLGAQLVAVRLGDHTPLVDLALGVSSWMRQETGLVTLQVNLNDTGFRVLYPLSCWYNENQNVYIKKNQRDDTYL